MKKVLSLIMCLFMLVGSVCPLAMAEPAAYVDMAVSGAEGVWTAVSAETEGMTMDKSMLEMMGMLIKLTLNADGTGSLEMEGEAEEIGWIQEDVTVTLSAMGDSLSLNLNEDGTMSGNFDGVIIVFEKEGGIVGVWTAVSAEADGMTMDKSMLEMMGMLIKLTLNEDGTGALEMEGEAGEISWAEADGVVTISVEGDSMTMNVNADGTLSGDFGGVIIVFAMGDGEGIEAPVDVPTEPVAEVAGSVDDFVGVWNAATMEMEGMTLNVSDLGMVMDLTINADGTIAMFDGESMEEGNWTLIDGKLDVMGEIQLTLTEDGRLCMAEEGAAIYFARGEASAEPVEVPVDAPADVDTSALIGTWFDGDTTNFTIYEDGTCVATDQYGDSWMGWEIVDGVPMITSGFWFDSPMILNEDGTLYVSDGWSVDKTFTFGAGEIRVGSTLEAPADVVMVDSPDAFYGEWIGETMVMESGSFALADMMMTMNLTINADGTMSLFDGAATDTASWTFAEGCLTAMDGMVEIALMADGRLCMAQEFNILYLTRAEGGEAVVDTPDAAPAVPAEAMILIGEWLKPDNGNKLNVNTDGTMVLTYPSGTVYDMTWAVENGEVVVTSGLWEYYPMTVNEEDILEIGMFEYERVSEPYTAPVETPVDVPAIIGGGEEDFVGSWTASTMEMEGMTINVADMGMTMQLSINADGTASMYDGESTETAAWTFVNGALDIEGMILNLTDDGRLCMAEDGAVMYFVQGDAAATPVTTPAESVDLASSPVVGKWVDGEGLIFTVNADGTCVVTDQYGDSSMEWNIEGGVPTVTSGYWWGATMTMNDDGSMYVTDGWVVDSDFYPEGTEVPAGAPDQAPDADVEAYLGDWAQADGNKLTINADGTLVLTYPDGEVREMTWMINTGTFEVTSGNWWGDIGTINADGVLNFGGSPMKDFTRVGAAETPAGESADDVVSVVAEAEDFVGRWIGQTMEMDGQSFALSDIGMTLEIEMGLYGNISLFDGETTEDGSWTLVDGKADIDGMILTLMSDGTMVAEDSDGAKVVFTGFIGTWKACYMSTGGLTGDLRSMGITSTLVLNADGTGSIDFPTPEEGVWYREEGILRFGENGMPMTVLPGGFLKFGSDLAGYLVFSQDETAVWDPSMAEPEAPVATEAPVAPAAPEAPANNGAVDMQALMDRKFVAKTYTAYGQTMDASMLGAEYSVLFRENGTCDFGIAGMVVPNLPWGLQKVATGLTEVDAFVINYYGTMFNAVITENGFDMDFYGTMTLNFVPAE